MTEIRQRGLRGHRVLDPAAAESRRRDILLAAARLFAERGFVGTTVDQIAPAAGLTKGLFYYYFPSKEDVYTEIQLTSIKGATDRFVAIVEQGLSPLLTLRAVVADLVASVVDGFDYYASTLRDWHHLSRDRRAELRQAVGEYEGMFSGLLHRAIESGQARSGNTTIAMNVLLHSAFSTAYWCNRHGFEPEDVVPETTRLLLEGILTPDLIHG